MRDTEELRVRLLVILAVNYNDSSHFYRRIRSDCVNHIEQMAACGKKKNRCTKKKVRTRLLWFIDRNESRGKVKGRIILHSRHTYMIKEAPITQYGGSGQENTQ